MGADTAVKRKVQLTSFVARIVKDLATFANDIPLPDSKHNVGNLLAQAYLWDIVHKHAKRQAEQMWEHLRNEGLVEVKLEPGDHVMCESPRFVCAAKVTEPVKRFSSEELGKLLRASKYKVPEPITREFVEQAKVPTRSTVILSIVER